MSKKTNIGMQWNRMTKLGCNESIPHVYQREIVVTNYICLLLIPLLILSIIIESINNNSPVIYSFISLFVLVIFLLWLNSRYKTLLSRILLSTIPVVLIILVPAFSPAGVDEANFIGFAFATLGLSIIPLLVFNVKHEKKYLIAALGFNFLFVVFYDKILLYYEGGNANIAYIQRNYLIFKSTQIMLWMVYTVGLLIFKLINLRFEELLNKNNEELQERHNDILTQNEEILSQNEELQQQQDQILEQRDYIEEQNSELKVYQDKLLDYVFRISQTKDELSKKEAEHQSILNALRQHFMVMEFDVDGNVTWLAPKTTESLRFDSEDIIGTNAALFMLPEKEGDNDNFKAIWEELLKGKSITRERRLILNKTQMWIRCTFAPIRDENDNIVRIMSISEDISDIKEKEKEISDYNELLQHQRKEIQEQNEELMQQKEEIATINETLEQRVQERTKVLEQKNKQLAEYAFINAHILRAPVSSILGLINLLGHEHLTKEGLELYNFLKKAALHLDKVVIKINDAINENKHFDREFLREDEKFYQ